MSDEHGLALVAPGTDPIVDIVFLHGLRGHMEQTWTKENVLWPSTLLPKDIPEARIFLFGYDSAIVHRKKADIIKTEVHSDAQDLCAQLVSERSQNNIGDRPLIFVAHSLGGLVVAQLFLHGEMSSDDAGAKSIVKNVRGMIFLGTPFGGSKAAKLAESVRRILDLFGSESQDQTLKLLEVDSKQAEELRRSFASCLNKRRTSKDPKDQVEAVFFYERQFTKVGIKYIQIVENESAQLLGCGDAIPVDADHRNICKFKTDGEDTYLAIVAKIREIMARFGTPDDDVSWPSIN
ncbi:putative ribonuclease p mrp protein [Fusarium acuminatum]|uniref:Ribonuclease p mrp protein n=1 Tax=Fusarium acuminatum TaxID=5515 RepID=A0ABZ2XB63_9HYPO